MAELHSLNRITTLKDRPSISPQNIITIRREYPNLYRFFKEREYAEALANGEIWLTTLETCRAYEAAGQGDPDEATFNFNSGKMLADGSLAKREEIARRFGIHFDESSIGNVIKNVRGGAFLADAYLICTTTRYAPKTMEDTFGKHCVKIFDPVGFALAISASLKNSEHGIIEAAMAPIEYRSITVEGLEPVPDFGFTKSEEFKDQYEFRFMWLPDPSKLPIEPFLLSCPEAKKYCRLLPYNSADRSRRQ